MEQWQLSWLFIPVVLVVGIGHPGFQGQPERPASEFLFLSLNTELEEGGLMHTV